MELLSGEVVVERPRTQHRVEKSLLEEALKKVSSSGQKFFVEQVEFDRVVGQTTRVQHQSGISRFYAKIEGRKDGYFPFIQAEPQDSTSLVVILKKAKEINTYVLMDAWVGTQAEPMPWDKKASKSSMLFWSQNSFVLGSEKIIPGSELDIPFVNEWDYMQVLEKAQELVNRYYPNASPQHKAAYSNSVAIGVTRMWGGYGGPSIREYLADEILGFQKYSFEYVFSMLLSSTGPIFGPVDERHMKIWNLQDCRDDDPEDLRAIKQLK